MRFCFHFLLAFLIRILGSCPMPGRRGVVVAVVVVVVVAAVVVVVVVASCPRSG